MPQLNSGVWIGGDDSFEHYEYDFRHGDEHERFEDRSKFSGRDDGGPQCQRNDSESDDRSPRYCSKHCHGDDDCDCDRKRHCSLVRGQQ